MGFAATRVTNISTNMRPTATLAGVAVTDQSTVVSSSVVDMLSSDLHDNTTHVFWTNYGDAVFATFDGSDPSGSNGHFIASGANGLWRREAAEVAKLIRSGGTDSRIHITEMAH